MVDSLEADPMSAPALLSDKNFPVSTQSTARVPTERHKAHLDIFDSMSTSIHTFGISKRFVSGPFQPRLRTKKLRRSCNKSPSHQLTRDLVGQLTGSTSTTRSSTPSSGGGAEQWATLPPMSRATRPRALCRRRRISSQEPQEELRRFY